MSTQWSPPDPSASQPPPYQMPGAQTSGDPAGFWRRLVALIIDWIIVGIVTAIISLIINAIIHATSSNSSYTGGGVGTVIWIIYLTYMWSAQGRTLGYMVMGMRLVRNDGTPVGVGAALARAILFWLSFVLCLIPAIVSAFMVGLSESKKAIHDHIAGTAVIQA